MAQAVSSQTKAIRKYLSQGMAPKDVAKKVRVNRQTVYNVQYQMRKAGQLPTPTPTSTGIVTPKRPTEVETGIASLTTPKVDQSVDQPKPSIWQRIKRVLGWQ